MALINVTGAAQDAEEGRIYSNPERVGNRTYGQRVFISGLEQPLETAVVEYQWYARETITVSSTAIALTANLRKNADIVLLTLEAANIYYDITSQAPTATTGHLMNAGDVIKLIGFWEIDQWQAIRVSVDATLRASYGQRRL